MNFIYQYKKIFCFQSPRRKVQNCVVLSFSLLFLISCAFAEGQGTINRLLWQCLMNKVIRILLSTKFPSIECIFWVQSHDLRWIADAALQSTIFTNQTAEWLLQQCLSIKSQEKNVMKIYQFFSVCLWNVIEDTEVTKEPHLSTVLLVTHDEVLKYTK